MRHTGGIVVSINPSVPGCACRLLFRTSSKKSMSGPASVTLGVCGPGICSTRGISGGTAGSYIEPTSDIVRGLLIILVIRGQMNGLLRTSYRPPGRSYSTTLSSSGADRVRIVGLGRDGGRLILSTLGCTGRRYNGSNGGGPWIA